MQKIINEIYIKYRFDHSTGYFHRRKSGHGNYVGEIAGTITDSGYRRIWVDGKGMMAHRAVWLITYGRLPDNEIDHINHDKDDNRISNLRDVSRNENMKNKGLLVTNTSGYTGISWLEKQRKWRVRVDGIKRHVGHYVSLSDAISARNSAYKCNQYHANHGASK